VLEVVNGLTDCEAAATRVEMSSYRESRLRAPGHHVPRASIRVAPAARILLRPAGVCRSLLAALDAFEGQRRRRKRDITLDALGTSLNRQLLEAAVQHDPDPDAFEGGLLARSLTRTGEISPGAVPAMARDVLAEWRLAAASADFRTWLAAGAQSEDRA
jgi:hypothetical protein